MISALRLLSAGALAAFVAFPLFADTLPDPATKSQVPPVTFVQARISTKLNFADFILTGRVHSDKTHKSYPLTLRAKGHVLVYEFTDQPLQLRVNLGGKDGSGVFSLEKRTSSSGTWSTVPTSQYTQPVLDTDITYGDLVLDFINWDDIQPLGTDTIKTLPSYVFDAHPGANDHSQFPTIRFWVSKEYWAFLRIDGLNAKGQTAKRVEVQNVMTIADKYTVFKEMKVSYMAPDKDDIATSTTYIDIDDGKEGSGLTDSK